MKLSTFAYAFLLLAPCYAQPSANSGNPLLGERNVLLRFSNVKAEHVKADRKSVV